jgi:hypothetical protein
VLVIDRKVCEYVADVKPAFAIITQRRAKRGKSLFLLFCPALFAANLF